LVGLNAGKARLLAQDRARVFTHRRIGARGVQRDVKRRRIARGCSVLYVSGFVHLAGPALSPVPNAAR
jgi:hypothetical protein